MTFHEWMELVAQIFEGLGAAVLLSGLFVAAILSVREFRSSHDGRRAYKVLRETFGGIILLGLEILVAADLVRTVAVAPTLENVAILGIIVLIRTLLSFSLEIEIEGVVPWRRAATSGLTRVARSVQRGGTIRRTWGEDSVHILCGSPIEPIPEPTTRPSSPQIDTAQAVCRGCPVRLACLDRALHEGIDRGPGADSPEHERRTLRRRTTHDSPAAPTRMTTGHLALPQEPLASRGRRDHDGAGVGMTHDGAESNAASSSPPAAVAAF